MVALFERLAAAGHDPYALTLHQALAFDKAAQERRRKERLISLMDAYAAHNASKEGFEGYLRKLDDEPDPDTLDFSEMD